MLQSSTPSGTKLKKCFFIFGFKIYRCEWVNRNLLFSIPLYSFLKAIWQIGLFKSLGRVARFFFPVVRWSIVTSLFTRSLTHSCILLLFILLAQSCAQSVFWHIHSYSLLAFKPFISIFRYRFDIRTIFFDI